MAARWTEQERERLRTLWGTLRGSRSHRARVIGRILRRSQSSIEGLSKQLGLRAEAIRANNSQWSDENPVTRLPERPTSAAPGSEEKLSVMAERASRGECLFHPSDYQGRRRGRREEAE